MGVPQNEWHPFGGVPIIRIIVFWGPYRGPPILGNFHMRVYVRIFTGSHKRIGFRD